MKVFKARSLKQSVTATKEGSATLKTNNKILIICGLTASGKTSLALKVAQKTGNISIISVDSRQAYQGLPILTGQDIPSGFTRRQDASCKYHNLPGVCFSNTTKSGTDLNSGSGHPDIRPGQNSIHIWGVDQVPPTQTLNISAFTKFAWQVIKKEASKGRKIIITGGTGLYLKAITEPIIDIHSGFDPKLRNNLSRLSIEELQKRIQNINSDHFNKMNRSDQLNPRRLIRAIEILKNPSTKKPTYLKLQKNANFRWVGLSKDLIALKKNIRARVIKRLKNGVINEIKSLKNLLEDHENPIYSALGLNLVLDYLKLSKNGSLSPTLRSQLVSKWVSQELAYAKRQLTWFKKQPSIIWYDQSIGQSKLITELSHWLKSPVHV